MSGTLVTNEFEGEKLRIYKDPLPGKDGDKLYVSQDYPYDLRNGDVFQATKDVDVYVDGVQQKFLEGKADTGGYIRVFELKDAGKKSKSKKGKKDSSKKSDKKKKDDDSDKDKKKEDKKAALKGKIAEKI